MALRLDHLLEPGERVLWRLPRAYVPRYALLALCLWGFSAGSRWLLRGFEPFVDGLTFGVFFVAVALVVVVYNLKGWSVGVLVTDRRLLHKVLWRQPVVTVIRFADIKSLEVGPGGGLLVQRADGAPLRFDDPRREQHLGAALAEATGLPCPATYGVLAQLNLFSYMAGMFLSFIGIMWINGLQEDTFDHVALSVPFDWLLFLKMLFPTVTVAVGGPLAGIPLVHWIGLAVLRPFVGIEQLRSWLANRPDEMPLGLYSRVTEALTRKWAALLWRTALGPENHEGEANGA